MNWLDTETHAILDPIGDSKLAPPKAGEFALVLLKDGADHQRLIRAIRRINDCTPARAEELACARLPVTINHGLTQSEAVFGQFELICCDSISAFIRSEVLQAQIYPEHLRFLFDKILQSPEFRSTSVNVTKVPATESGKKFLDQFLGMHSLDSSEKFSVSVPFKKARIMKHWAARIGAEIECEAIRDTQTDL